jgi:hypothetical protein
MPSLSVPPLKVYIDWYVAPFFASYFTQRLITHVSMCYTEMIIDGRFCSACEEIGPYVLMSVIHSSVKRLDFVRNEAHPSLLDYSKYANGDLIYRTLPFLREFKEMKLGKLSRDNVQLETEDFRTLWKNFLVAFLR